MSTTNPIVELFDKLLQESTFNVDALEGIQELKKKAIKLETENEKLMKEKEVLDTKYNGVLSEKYLLIDENKKLRERLSNIEVRELKADLQEVKLQAEKEKQALVLDMFKTVFKPSSVRETVTRSIPMAIEGQAPNSYGNPPHVEVHTELTTTETSHE